MIFVWLVVFLAALLVVSLLAVGIRAGVALWRRAPAHSRSPGLKKRAPRRERHPVVLAHGILGFDELGLGAARVSYFRGIVERLRSQGVEVHCARVPPLASVQVRAAHLAEMVRALAAPQVNLVAHSMGGLDARYAISRLGLGQRVASLITIGTPHRGTPIADLGAELLRRLRLDLALGPISELSLGQTPTGRGAAASLWRAACLPIIDVQALHDLTTSRMLAFNRDVRDVPGVRYLSVVARAPRGSVHPLLVPAYHWLHRNHGWLGGENDGLVPARSQRWGQVLREIEADHWSQIGWSSGGPAGGFDAITLYDEILQELKALGL